MFCSKCGSQIPENSMFCAHCGTSIGTNNITSSHSGPNTFQYTSGTGTYNQASQPTYQYSTNHSGMSPSFNSSFSYNVPPKKSKAPLIIGLVATTLIIGIIALIIIILSSGTKDNDDTYTPVADRDIMVQNGYITEEQDYDKALSKLIDVYIGSIYDNDYELFKTCMFPGDFDVDRDYFSEYTDDEYMDICAPVYPGYDDFTQWNIEITESTSVENATELAELNEKYELIGNMEIETYHDIYFDLTIKSEDRTIIMPCNAELVYADGHWYLWYAFFDAWNYYKDSYEFTGSGTDLFVRDYIPDEEVQ